jgi:hypothetical protein
LKLAQDCYAQARAALHLSTKRHLVQMDDEYQKQADELQHRRAVIQAAFPKLGGKIG